MSYLILYRYKGLEKGEGENILINIVPSIYNKWTTWIGSK